MKILFTSDWHLDASTCGVDRFDDVVGAVKETVETAIAEKVDLYVFLGDLCDPDANRSPRCVSVAIDVARELRANDIESRWLTGNHCVIEDGSGTSVLSPLKAAEMKPSADMPGWRVIDEPTVELLSRTPNGPPIAFVWLPYVPRCASYDAKEFVRDADVLAARNVDARSFAPKGQPHVVVGGHLSIRDMHPGSETIDMPRGRDLWLPVDEIAERWPGATVVNGHYHRAELPGRLQRGGVLIPGSLARLTFGEEANTPGFLIVEVP